MTNREHINNMSNKEFAEFMDTLNGSGNAPYCNFCAFNLGSCYYHCLEGYQKWLEQEAENEKA